MKGWSFAHYAQMNDRAAYDNINKRTLEHRDKINKGISEEGYIMRENLLQLEDEFSAKYESERFDNNMEKVFE